MTSFNKTLKLLSEKLITFGGKAYPTSGHVVILAGGSGVGKGFIQSNLLGIEGYNFNVDTLKELTTRVPALVKEIEEEFGHDISKFDMKNPEHVAILHDIIGYQLKLSDKRLAALLSSILMSHESLKPNLIFDVTLKDLKKLYSLTQSVKSVGYAPENIHIVWVLNDIEVAKSQNQSRPRTVPIDILINSHAGVSQTMRQLVDMGDSIKNYMDGDIVFVFNQAYVDTELVKSTTGGSYIKNADYVYIKRSGQPQLSVAEIDDAVLAKVGEYVPEIKRWEK